MSELIAAYSVVLRTDLPPRARDILSQLCCEVASTDGEPLLHFQCTKLDLSHPFYIEMETFKPGARDTHPVRIPHGDVFLNSGDETRPAVGFVPDLTR